MLARTGVSMSPMVSTTPKPTTRATERKTTWGSEK